MNENNKKSYKISASILSADFAKLGQEIDEVLRFGVDMIHFDVMDNHYVPNLTFGPLVCKALREHGIKAPIDVHLMTCPVERLILEFARAGATYITFHTGACNHVDRALQMVLDSGCKAGIALNPASTTNHLNYILQKLDIVLVMSVNPGFPGQEFIVEILPKIQEIRNLIDKNKSNAILQVDGGVNLQNIRSIVDAGADSLVTGSSLFNSDNYKETS